MRPMSPEKATRKYLQKHKWTFYEWDVDLTQDLVVGPFDFVTIQGEKERVPGEVWRELQEKANEFDLDVSTLEKIVPLK